MTLNTLELEDELTRLTLAPELGASIVNWTIPVSYTHLTLPTSDLV